MRVIELLSKFGRNYSAVLSCEHCGATEQLSTGYADKNYEENVLPAIACQKCHKIRDGREVPENVLRNKGCMSVHGLDRLDEPPEEPVYPKVEAATEAEPAKPGTPIEFPHPGPPDYGNLRGHPVNPRISGDFYLYDYYAARAMEALIDKFADAARAGNKEGVKPVAVEYYCVAASTWALEMLKVRQSVLEQLKS